MIKILCINCKQIAEKTTKFCDKYYFLEECGVINTVEYQ